nr:RecName: Full=Putative carbonic anhydrase 2 [Lottia gigantea]
AYRQTENLLYGRSFHAEAHIVHHHSDFADVAEASKHLGGIAVVSIFLTNDKQRYNPTTNRALDTILNHLKDLIEFTEEEHVCRAENRRIKRTGIYSKLGVERACRENNPNYDADSPDGDPSNKCQLHKKARGCGDPIENVTFNPNDLLSSIPTYLTFEGGLTTPPCSESVIWIVAEHPAYISNKNIEYMNKLKSRIVNQTISDFGNLRPLHDPAERDVFRIIYGRYPPRREEDDERGDGRHDLRDDDDNYDDDDYYNDDYSNDDYYDDDYYYDDYDDDTDDDHKDDGRRDRGGGDDKGGRGKGDDRGGRDNGDNRTGRGNRNDRGRRGNGDDSGGRGNGNNRDGRGNGDSRDRNNGNGNGRENGGVRGNGNDRDGRRDNGNGGDNGTRRGNGDDRGGRRNEDRGENRRGKDDQERESEDGRRRRRRFNGRRRRRGRGDDKGDDKGDDN